MGTSMIMRGGMGTALVLSLGACAPIWWLGEVTSFRKDGKIDYQDKRYSFRYENRAGGNFDVPMNCVNGQAEYQSGEKVVVEVADMGRPVLAVKPLEGAVFTCQDIEHWKDKVYPIAAAACRSIKQTPLTKVKLDRDVHLTEDGSIEIWEMCI